MSHAGFVDVWNLALAAVAGEPIFARIAIALGAAFALAMCIEGLYASFFPLRYAARVARNHTDRTDDRPSQSARIPAPADGDAPGTVRTASRSALSAPRKNRKLASIPLSRHRPTIPRIQRIAMVNAAPAPATEAPRKAPQSISTESVVEV